MVHRVEPIGHVETNTNHGRTQESVLKCDQRAKWLEPLLVPLLVGSATCQRHVWLKHLQAEEVGDEKGSAVRPHLDGGCRSYRCDTAKFDLSGRRQGEIPRASLLQVRRRRGAGCNLDPVPLRTTGRDQLWLAVCTTMSEELEFWIARPRRHLPMITSLTQNKLWLCPDI